MPQNGAVGEESDLRQGRRAANVIRVLSLVPDAVREYMGIRDELGFASARNTLDRPKAVA